MRQGSLVRRLVWLAAGWILAALLITGLVLTASFQRTTIRQFERGLADVLEALLTGTNVTADGTVLTPILRDARNQRVYSGRYWQVAEFAPDGGLTPLGRSRSLFDTELNAPPEVLARLRAAPGRTVFYDTRGPAGEPLRAAATAAKLPGRSELVIFMAGEDRSPLDADARLFGLTTAAALLVLGTGLVLAVFVQVRVGLRPVFEIRREIARVRRGRAQRLTGTYPEELAPLSSELNALLDHNQEVVERQRTHVGNLAHALKTPVSVLLSEAERHPGELAEVVGRQAHAMRDHVDHHLRRARAAARVQGQGERTELAPVLEELTLTLERIFQDKNVAIDWDAPDDLAFLGERQDLLEIAGNVMENACKWARGRVRVRGAAEPGRADRLRIIVEDDGPGLPAERRAEVLQRGARLDESAPGSGLGLSIVDELARAYGGGVSLNAAAMGGLRVEVTLPRAE
ncbi:MAG: sensor histidine kinase [Pseudomonadota bacterium]|nr:sensor histidine kinase [Pseudomonadota bacterium]